MNTHTQIHTQLQICTEQKDKHTEKHGNIHVNTYLTYIHTHKVFMLNCTDMQVQSGIHGTHRHTRMLN